MATSMSNIYGNSSRVVGSSVNTVERSQFKPSDESFCNISKITASCCLIFTIIFIALVIMVHTVYEEKFEFTTNALDRQNYYRLIYGSVLLKNNSKLVLKAVSKAKQLVKFAFKGIDVPTPTFNDGVCTFCKSVPHAVHFYLDGMDIGEKFFSGHVNYNYTSHMCNSGPNGTVDHVCHCFTQMIWRSTTDVGCAYARFDNYTYYAACVYHPVGNIPGKYKDNVPMLNTSLRVGD